MKGQTQAITAVMLTSVVVGSIGTVYLWGTPMLEKRQAQEEVSETESDVKELYNQIVETSRQGSGASTSVEIKADRISLNAEKDYIQVKKELDQAAEQGISWNLLKGSSFQNITLGAGDYGIAGQDLPGVVAYRAVAGEDSSEITYRIEFRNLCSESTGELQKIDLEAEGSERAAGTTSIRVYNRGTETDNGIVLPGGACEGQTSRTRNLVGIELE